MNRENMSTLLFLLAIFPILTHQAKYPNPNGKFYRRSLQLGAKELYKILNLTEFHKQSNDHTSFDKVL